MGIQIFGFSFHYDVLTCWLSRCSGWKAVTLDLFKLGPGDAVGVDALAPPQPSEAKRKEHFRSTLH